MSLITQKRVLWCWRGAVAAVCIESLIPYGSLPGGRIPVDAIARAAAFFLLALIPMYSFGKLRNAVYAALSMAVLGIVLEVLQQYVPGRSCSAGDMIANNLGVLLGFFVGLLIRFRKAGAPSRQDMSNAHKP